jgi:hypothetical protein
MNWLILLEQNLINSRKYGKILGKWPRAQTLNTQKLFGLN